MKGVPFGPEETSPSFPNIVKSLTPRIEGRKSKAPAMKRKRTGDPIEMRVGLSLCCLNFRMAVMLKLRPFS